MTYDWSAARISEVRFRPVRARHGYDMGEVDAFLDQLVRAVEAGTPLAPLVAQARFSTTALREGYEMSEVDDFLDEVAGDTAPAAPAATPAATQATPPPPQPVPAVGEPQPVAVQEQRGLLARLFGRR